LLVSKVLLSMAFAESSEARRCRSRPRAPHVPADFRNESGHLASHRRQVPAFHFGQARAAVACLIARVALTYRLFAVARLRSRAFRCPLKARTRECSGARVCSPIRISLGRRSSPASITAISSLIWRIGKPKTSPGRARTLRSSASFCHLGTRKPKRELTPIGFLKVLSVLFFSSIAAAIGSASTLIDRLMTSGCPIIEPRFEWTVCGKRGADVRPDSHRPSA
jgi:hypothetical protein